MSWFHDRFERRLCEIRGYDDIAPDSETLHVTARRPRPDRAPRRSKQVGQQVGRELVRRGATAEPIPAPRTGPSSALAGRLVDRWCAASVVAGWSTPGCWWNPAVDEVVEAIMDDDDHITPCVELARWRAKDGVPLADTLNDLEALFTAARLGPPPFATVRAVSLAWAEEIADYTATRGCVDRRSGLATEAHVRARLAELYREASWAGHSLSETHCLVLVELVEADDGDLWNDALRMTDVAECMLAVFDAGQTIGHMGDGRAVAIVARSSELTRNVECLRRLLNDWHRFGSPGPSPRVWVESLPRGADTVGRLLKDLAC